MTDCNHNKVKLDNRGIISHAVYGDRGVPRQITHSATCSNCGKDMEIDYNITFIDGESV